MSHRHTMQKRHRTTVWLNRDLWQEFMEKVKTHHLSTCLALEGLMSAYVYGGSLVPGQTGPQVVNVTIEREEMRPRRREDERYVRKKKVNHYEPRRGWYFDATLDPGMIVIEQPKEWEKNMCAADFTWSRACEFWWKKE